MLLDISFNEKVILFDDNRLKTTYFSQILHIYDDFGTFDILKRLWDYKSSVTKQCLSYLYRVL